MNEVMEAERVMDRLRAALLAHTQADATFEAQDVEGFFSRQKSSVLQLIERALVAKRSRRLTIPDAFGWGRLEVARAEQGHFGETAWGGYGGHLITPSARASLESGARIIDRHGRHGSVKSITKWRYSTFGGSHTETDVTFLADSTEREDVVKAADALYVEVERPTQVPMDPFILTSAGTSVRAAPHELFGMMFSKISYHLVLYRLALWIEDAQRRRVASLGILAECRTKMNEQNPIHVLTSWNAWQEYFRQHPHLRMADVSTFNPWQYHQMSLHMNNMRDMPLSDHERREYQYLLENWAAVKASQVEVGDEVTVSHFHDHEPLRGTVIGQKGIAYQVRIASHEYDIPVSGLKLAGVPDASATLQMLSPLNSLRQLMQMLADPIEYFNFAVRSDVAAVRAAVVMQDYLDAYASKVCQVSVKQSTSVKRGRRGSAVTQYEVSIVCDDVTSVIGMLCETQYMRAASGRQLLFDPSAVEWVSALAVTSEQAKQLLPFLAVHMFRTGISLSRIGLMWLNVDRPPMREDQSLKATQSEIEIPAETSDYEQKTVGSDCMEITFNSPKFGLVRVVCGARGRRDVWHNVWVGNTRYGWNGKRWARDMVPPADVLAELLERGVNIFQGDRYEA